MYSSHLDKFKESPREDDCSKMVVKSAKMDHGHPPRVPSSRYHTLNVVTSSLAKEWIARLKRTGPKGSPCCTPVVDEMMESPKKGEMRYDKLARQMEINKYNFNPKETVSPNTIKSITVVNLKENHRATMIT